MVCGSEQLAEFWGEVENVQTLEDKITKLCPNTSNAPDCYSTILNSKRSNFHPFCHAAEHLSVRHERCIAECNHAFLVEENPKMAALFDGYAGLLASNLHKDVQRYCKIH